MKYWKQLPNNIHVAKYVECYWFLEKEPSDLGTNFPKLNPDPTAHLIIATATQTFQYNQMDTSQTGCGNYWIFPHRNTFTMDHSDLFQIIGIKFKTGALYSLNTPFSGSKLEQIEEVNMNALIASERFCSDLLLMDAAEKPEHISNVLDGILAPWVLQSHEDKHSELVRLILPLLDRTSISEIGDVLHRSQRTIERSFLRVTGLTLKQCQSMIRLEAILNYLYKLDDADIDWADLVTQFEFSDQPHLIRHLKNAIGKTPGEYARERDLTIDIYGGFELS
ncbi:helix-turn-helix domain-containing protein [Marinomonas sp. 2405UD68-3]|uniref:helix-turn-helix domain-containing protein n=1 Tax=Marinomonas sp. 2405UD68-3 TaxID=3391835 RepID=UPI0039C8CCB0